MMHVQSDYKAEKKIRIKLLGRWTEELFEKESVKERTEENLSRKVARILEVNLSTLFGTSWNLWYEISWFSDKSGNGEQLTEY